MGCAGNLEELLVLGAGSLSEGILGHIEGISLFASNEQQGLVNELDVISSVPAHQLHEAAGGVAEGRVRMTMGATIVNHALAIEVSAELGNAFISKSIEIYVAE